MLQAYGVLGRSPTAMTRANHRLRRCNSHKEREPRPQRANPKVDRAEDDVHTPNG